MLISIFFVALEFFTASTAISVSQAFSEYLFVGLEGHKNLVPFMWMFVILAIVAIVLLLNPKTRTNEKTLRIACISVFASMWLEKGLGLVVAGFIPNPFDQVREYAPTIPELTIAFGVWATGILVLTILYKIAVSVKEEVA